MTKNIDGDIKLGYQHAMDGKDRVDHPNEFYQNGYRQGLKARGNANSRLDRLAERYDAGEFRGPGEYLSAISQALQEVNNA